MVTPSYLEHCMALRCFVEHGGGTVSDSLPKEGQQKFVIVPKAVLLSDLPKFILDYLDITKPNNLDDCNTFIILPNWKPIPLHDVCEKPRSTSAVSVLSQISNIALIKIMLPCQEANILPSNVMRSLLKSLIPQLSEPVSLTWLKHAGCPLSEPVVEAFLANPDDYEFESQARKEFSEWHSRMCLQYLEQISKASNPYNMPMYLPPLFNLGNNGGSGMDSGSEDAKPIEKVFSDKQRSRATRIRTSFDPDMEIPMLQKWFSENSHPTREQMEEFKNVLNELPCRKNKRSLDITNIIYWFKNMRAYEKRNSSLPNASQLTLASKQESANDISALRFGESDFSFGDTNQTAEDVESIASDTENGDLVMVADENDYRKENNPISGVEVDLSNDSSQDVTESESLTCNKSDSWGLPFPPLLGAPYFAATLLQRSLGNVDLTPGSEPTANELKGSTQLNSSLKRRRTRVFIDPASEIPQLELWFAQESHPDSRRFQEFADYLNSRPFRLKQPKLEAKNIQLWFKNHRAKVKRERMDTSQSVDADVSPEGQGLSLPLTPNDDFRSPASVEQS